MGSGGRSSRRSARATSGRRCPGATRRPRSPTGCSTRRACSSLPAAGTARAGRGLCGSRSPSQTTGSPRRWNASAGRSRDGPLMAQNGKARGRGVHEASTLESPLAATWRPRVPEKAVLVGVGRGIEEADLDELAALADSAGAEPVERVLQTRQDPNPATFVGKGKINEVHDAVHRSGAEAVILDDELTPGQLRSLEERLKVKVIDRTALILDISRCTHGAGRARPRSSSRSSRTCCRGSAGGARR